MKTIKFLFATLAILFIVSCQKSDVSTADNNSAITADSQLANLLLRVSKNNTSNKSVSDDDKSCFEVKLPAKFDFNGIDFVVKDASDIEKIEKAIKDFLKDIKSTNFGFPLTLVVDGKEVVVKDAKELAEIAKKCDKFEDADAIDDVKINYPITIKTLDDEGKTIKEIVIKNDDELKEFLKSLDKKTKITLAYPITLKDLNGKTITVNSNKELQELIEDAVKGEIEKIKEEIKKDLSNIMVSFGKYDVKIDDKSYKLSFAQDGTVSATAQDGMVVQGKWSINIDGGTTTFTLKFDDSKFASLNQTFTMKQSNFGSFVLEGKDAKGNIIKIDFAKLF